MACALVTHQSNCWKVSQPQRSLYFYFSSQLISPLRKKHAARRRIQYLAHSILAREKEDSETRRREQCTAKNRWLREVILIERQSRKHRHKKDTLLLRRNLWIKLRLSSFILECPISRARHDNALQRSATTDAFVPFQCLSPSPSPSLSPSSSLSLSIFLFVSFPLSSSRDTSNSGRKTSNETSDLAHEKNVFVIDAEENVFRSLFSRGRFSSCLPYQKRLIYMLLSLSLFFYFSFSGQGILLLTGCSEK